MIRTRECVRKNLLQLTSFTIPPGVYEFDELSKLYSTTYSKYE